MANEIIIDSRIKLSNGSLKGELGSTGNKFDQITARLAGDTQTIGTTEEAIDVGDVATPTFAALVNLDSTNFIQVGVKPAATFYPLMRLAVGDPPAQFRLDTGITLYAKADTASCDMAKLILET